MPESAPPLPDRRSDAERAIARGAGLAAVSSLTMLVLGGLSAVISVRTPWSASFAISVAVIVNGLIERHAGRRLRARDGTAPRWLVLNQLALGVEIAAYALWQSRAMSPERIEALLQGSLVARVLALVPPEVLEELLVLLPRAVSLLYLVVGAGAFLGCAATAWYYGSRSRWLRRLAGEAAGTRTQTTTSPA